jgi:signal transduction histidine kinase
LTTSSTTLLREARGPLGVALVTAVPAVAVLGLAHGSDAAATLSSARTLAVAIGLTVAAVLLFAHGRVATNEQSEWLALALGTPAVLALARAGYALTHADDEPALRGDVQLVSAAALAVSVALLVMAAGARTRLRPLGVALPLGAALLVAQQLLLTDGRGVVTATRPLAVAHLLLAVVVVLALQRLTALPRWLRTWLGAGWLVAATAACVVPLLGAGTPAATVALVLAVPAALAIVTAAAALLRQVIVEEQDHRSVLQDRLATAEAVWRDDRARLHEVNTMVASIASASRLIAEDPDAARRADLEGLVLAELDRLRRVLDRRADEPVDLEPVDLDAVVRRIAAAHRTRGHQVSAPASGVVATGAPDDIAEILDILVENAAQHGSPDAITIAVERRLDAVEIQVADRGPGVGEALQDRLFEWGERRPGSPGQGIGLYAADSLARRLGGRLRLDHSTTGARFVLRLPAPAERTLHDGLRHT